MEKLTKWIIRAAGLGILLGLLALPSFAKPTVGTVLTWVNSGNPGQTCLAITAVDNQPSSGYFFCPNQATSFDSPNYSNIGSLYVPSEPGFQGDGVYEDMTITWSQSYNVTYVVGGPANGKVNTFDKDGTFAFAPYMTGTTTQHYQNVYGYNRRNQYVLLGTKTVGGSGTVTATE